MNVKIPSLFPDLPIPPSRRPTEPIMREALLEPPYRFWLKRAWGAGPQIAWAMLNPSTANGLVDDPTMWRVMEFSLRWGFGSCVVVNIYPFQASKPADMKVWRKKFKLDWCEPPTPEWHDWHGNIEWCAELLSGADRRVAAWGAGADPQDVSYWLEGIACERSQQEAPESVVDVGRPIQDWVCLGTTADGAPKHPLARGRARVPADFEPVPWAFPQ